MNIITVIVAANVLTYTFLSPLLVILLLGMFKHGASLHSGLLLLGLSLPAGLSLGVYAKLRSYRTDHLPVFHGKEMCL